jgi:UDP-galactopyranose mutase
LPLIKTLQPDKIIYDCMDALTHFKYAPPQLAEREEALLQHADVVFCGGVSLYRARAGRHRNIHCFPSSVDAAHFARPGETHGAEDIQAGVPRPRIGYCGVIDERIDLHLIAEAARARPDWQFVLVGPVVKIEPTQVPVLPNVHHFGQQPYAELPRFMAGWDVAIMPFALNDATRFISPTKTLEYLAADRPVVSTPVADVVAAYAGVVEIASNGAEFVAACERLLHETGDAREARRAAMRRCVAATSWEKTAGEMWALVEAAPLKTSRASPARVERLAKRRGAVPQPAEDDATPVAKSA